MRKVKEPIQTKDDWGEIEEFITVANRKKMEKEEYREKSQRKKRLPRK